MSRIEHIQRFPVQVANPAPGANLVLRPGGVGVWRVLHLAFTFTTSAVVANRTVSLEATDGTTTYFRTVAGSVQAASVVGRYGAIQGGPSQAAVGVVNLIAWPHEGLALYEGYQLRSVVDNLDAADTFTLIGAMVEELPSGRYLYITPVESAQAEEW